jgi:hypothetical protein
MVKHNRLVWARQHLLVTVREPAFCGLRLKERLRALQYFVTERYFSAVFVAIFMS